jgi:hypothetical protein
MYSTYSSFMRQIVTVHSDMLQSENVSTTAAGNSGVIDGAQLSSDLGVSGLPVVEEISCPPSVDSHGVSMAGANFLTQLRASNSSTLTNVAFVKYSQRSVQ